MGLTVPQPSACQLTMKFRKIAPFQFEDEAKTSGSFSKNTGFCVDFKLFDASERNFIWYEKRTEGKIFLMALY